jgi:hypothetical protein
MKLSLGVAVLMGIFASTCQAQTPVDIQPVKELKRTNSLSTCGYKPTDKEAPYFKKPDANEQATGSFTAEYDIHKKQEKYVSWFGIVRGALDAKPSGSMTLLLEQKYFDGLTDCHIMLVSHAGSGDFQATLGPIDGEILPLTLVRVYGKVDSEKNGVPHLAVEYVRVWPWGTFTFTDMGPGDKGNPEWAKFCQICKKGRIYNPYPDRNYYLGMLGDPKDLGTVPGGR